MHVKHMWYAYGAPVVCMWSTCGISQRTLTTFFGVVALHYQHHAIMVTECHNPHKHSQSPLTNVVYICRLFGVYVRSMWYVREAHVVCMWSTCRVFMVHMWDACGGVHMWGANAFNIRTSKVQMKTRIYKLLKYSYYVVPQSWTGPYVRLCTRVETVYT